MSQLNFWGVSYSSISFFEKALSGHKKVESFKRLKDICFVIVRTDGTIIRVLLVDEYTLGLAAVLRALDEFPDIDYVVTAGNWNGYTREAKEYGTNNGIGIFNAGEFLGALWWTEPKKYHQKDEDGNPKYPYREAV